MKVEKSVSTQFLEGIYGILLVPEDDEDRKIIERFWKGGIKKNALGNFGHKEKCLQLTFKDATPLSWRY